jgi:hypothetical protein
VLKPSPPPADLPPVRRLSITGLGLLACGALPLAACEHGIGLQGKVNVPSQVQRMFSAQQPGELVVKAQMIGQAITAPSVILCDSTSADRVIQVKFVKLACASEDTALVSAWVVPRTAQEVSCSQPPAQPRSLDVEQTSTALAFARAVVPVNLAAEAPTGCRDGWITFALTLAPR